MPRPARLLLALLLALTPAVASAEAKPAPAAAKRAPPPGAAKPTARAAGAFDARDPASLVALLGEMGAKGELRGGEADAVYVRVTTPTYGFNAQFAGCDSGQKACKAVVFSAPATRGTATLAQLNRFNQTAIACHAYQDQAGKLIAVYDALIFARDGKDELTQHLGAWQGCLATFGEFLDDPNAYLASAP